MVDHISETIKQLQKEMEPLEQKLAKLRSTVNQLCEVAGLTPVYKEIEQTRTTTSFASDEFFGQPLASSVRTILDARKATLGDGPATVREIYDALVASGYEFDAKDAQNSMRGLRVSLGKNTPIFYKFDNGKIGLVEWYPKINRKRGKGKTQEDGGELTDQDNDLTVEAEEAITENDADLDF